MEGRLFTPIGVTYIVSIAASLFVALTVTPVLCYWLLPSIAAKQTEDGWFVRHLKNGAEVLIRFSMKHPIGIAASVGSLCIVGLLILATTGSEFLPPFNEGSAQVNLVLPTGTSLETSDAFGQRAERVVLDVDGVAAVGRRTGRAEGDEHAMDVNISEMIVSFDPDSPRTRAEVLHDIREGLEEEFPGVSTSTEQPLAHLLSHLLSGVTAQVAIKVEGPDLTVLHDVAKTIEERLGSVAGVTDLMMQQSDLTARIEVEPRRADLGRHGLRVRDVAETVELALEGEEVSRLIKGDFSYPIIVRLRPEDRRRPTRNPCRRCASVDAMDARSRWRTSPTSRRATPSTT